MFEKIKTITDKSKFEKIFYKFFVDGHVYLNLENGDVKVKFFGYSDGQVAFRITQLKNVSENCMIISKKGMYTIYLYLKFIEKQEDDIFIFAPSKFQFITSARKEDRNSVEEEHGGKSLVFVTNVVSDFIIENTLAQRLKKTDHIREQINHEMEKAFDYMKVYLCNEGTSDPRMRYFLSERTPIFIPDFSIKPLKEGEKIFSFYINNIYSSDRYLKKRKEIVSEISVPFLYQGKMPYGYIQVNGKIPFSEVTLSSVKKFSVYVDELFKVNNIFIKTGDKFIVNSLSRSGFGIVFKERKYIRYFKDNSMVYLDMVLPGKKKASILSAVKHISILPNKTISIGFEIKEIDALGEINYEEFVKSIIGSPAKT